jgi:tetratricopeptide (TPR) repeat protein
MRGENKKALRMFRKALQVNPKFYHSARHIAVAYFEMGEYDHALQAIDDYRAVAATAEARADAHTFSAAICGLLGRNAQALAHLDSVRALDPLSIAPPFVARTLGVDSATIRAYDRQWFAAIQNRFASVIANPNLFLSALVMALRFDIYPRELSLLVAHNAGSPWADGPGVALAGIQPAMIYLGGVRELERGSGEFDPTLLAYVPDLGALYWMAYEQALMRSPSSDKELLNWTRGYADFAARSGNRSYEVAARLSEALVHRRCGESEAAEAILRTLGFPGEGHWLVLGPFQGANGFNRRFIDETATTFAPVVRHDKQTLHWRPAEDDLPDGFVDLWTMFGKSRLGSAYARTEFTVPTAREATLRFGYRAGLKVWLNGKQVWLHNGSERASIDGWVVPVRLQAGRNVILLKTTQRIGDWGFYFRITDESGGGFEDMQYLTP